MSNFNGQPFIVEETVAGTPATISVASGFVPSVVWVLNKTSGALGCYDQTMAAGSLNVVSKGNRLRGAVTSPDFAIVSNYDVKNNVAYSFTIDGILYHIAATQTFDTGTTKTITAAKWSSAKLSITGGTETVTWAASSYDTEALAIAALPATPDGHAFLGYITVLAHASGFTAGTDALTTGTGGNVATTTNYYNLLGTGEQGGLKTSGGITPVKETIGTVNGFTLGTIEGFNDTAADVLAIIAIPSQSVA